MAAAIRCGSPGSSQNGCSSSAGIGGRMRSPAKSSQCASQPSPTRKRTNSFAAATCPPLLKTAASTYPVVMASGWPWAPFGHAIVTAFL